MFPVIFIICLARGKPIFNIAVYMTHQHLIMIWLVVSKQWTKETMKNTVSWSLNQLNQDTTLINPGPTCPSAIHHPLVEKLVTFALNPVKLC